MGAGVQRVYIAPSNFEHFKDNSPKDHPVTLISKFLLKVFTPVFKFLMQPLVTTILKISHNMIFESLVSSINNSNVTG